MQDGTNQHLDFAHFNVPAVDIMPSHSLWLLYSPTNFIHLDALCHIYLHVVRRHFARKLRGLVIKLRYYDIDFSLEIIMNTLFGEIFQHLIKCVLMNSSHLRFCFHSLAAIEIENSTANP